MKARIFEISLKDGRRATEILKDVREYRNLNWTATNVFIAVGEEMIESVQILLNEFNIEHSIIEA